MALLAKFHARLARLSLRARLRTVISSLAIPMLVSALAVVLVQVYAASAWHTFAEQDERALQLALKGSASLPALETPATRRAALSALRAQMRDISALSGDPNVRQAAQAVTLLSYEYEAARTAGAGAGATMTAPAPLGPLLDELVVQASGAAAQAQSHAVLAGRIALGAMILLPALALAGAVALASGITRSIDGTLRDCIAFAGEIAAGNFSHGASSARPAARARHIDADPDSASEFDILVRSMNRIADETVTAAEREVEQTARLERLERAWALRSACSKSLVQAESEAELVSAICGHLVELGGYRVAWVGYARDDEAHSVEVAAQELAATLEADSVEVA
eukprot:gene43133-53539_t